MYEKGIIRTLQCCSCAWYASGFCHMSQKSVSGTHSSVLSFSLILKCYFSRKVIFWCEIKEEISSYHFVYSLSFFEFPAAIAIHLNSLKKFFTSTLGVLITIQICSCLEEFLWTNCVRSILCAVLNANSMKSRFFWGILWPVLLLDWNL